MRLLIECFIFIAFVWGCGLALLMTFAWDQSPRFKDILNSNLAKFISSDIKLLCAFYLAFIASTPANDRNPLLPYALAAVVFVWEAVEFAVKRKEARTIEDIATLNLTIERRAKLLSSFYSLVGDKIELIRTEIKHKKLNSGKGSSIKNAFGNQMHVDELLSQIVRYFSTFNDKFSGDSDLSIRIGFYVANEGQLEVMSSYDLKLAAHGVLRSYRDHPLRFNLNGVERPSKPKSG